MSRCQDSLLYNRIRQKDKEALELLYDRYEKILFSFLVKLTQDQHLAEETMQEVFLKIWKGTGVYDETKGKFISWIFTMARNASLDLIRKKKEKHAIPFEEMETIANYDYSVEELAEWKEEKHLVQQAIAKLSEEQKLIIHLLYFKGYTQKKISDTLEIPLGTVKSRVRLALQNLRKLLHAESERRSSS